MLTSNEWQVLALFCVIAYLLAFYFKNLSNLPEKHGWFVFIFLHMPIFMTLIVTSEDLESYNNTTMTLTFANVFLLRFFQKDV